MREIKFRAWNPENKSMVEFDNEKAANDIYIAKHLLTLMANKHELGENLLMQFTGLQDKNGIDIYEGDIIEWNSCGWKVRYMTDSELTSAGFYCESANGQTFYCFSKTMKPAVVIGNIHSNPELLEK